MQRPASDRLVSGLATLAIQALLGAAFLFGRAVETPKHVDLAFKTLDVVLPATPPQQYVPPPRTLAQHRAPDVAPAGLKARPTDIEPPPLINIPILPPLIAAPVADEGTMDLAGSARLADAGAGSGGRGKGFGLGGDGDGGLAPRRIIGSIRDGDYPPDLWVAGVGGTVSVRYHVEVDGSVTGCSVTATSGNTELDAVTCRLIERRFRYRPALDERGQRVRATIVEDHSWVIDDSELHRPRRGG